MLYFYFSVHLKCLLSSLPSLESQTDHSALPEREDAQSVCCLFITFIIKLSNFFLEHIDVFELDNFTIFSFLKLLQKDNKPIESALTLFLLTKTQNIGILNSNNARVLLNPLKWYLIHDLLISSLQSKKLSVLVGVKRKLHNEA